MKNFLILTAVLTVIFVAFIDTKARIEELDEIAATTQVQVESTPVLNKSEGTGIKEKYNTIQPPQTPPITSTDTKPLQTSQDRLSPRPQDKFQPMQLPYKP